MAVNQSTTSTAVCTNSLSLCTKSDSLITANVGLTIKVVLKTNHENKIEGKQEISSIRNSALLRTLIEYHQQLMFFYLTKFRDHLQTLVRGGWCKWKIILIIFWGGCQTSTKFRAPFLPWKLWVNPVENHVISIFTRKFVVPCHFSRPPLQGSMPPSKYLWTDPYM